MSVIDSILLDNLHLNNKLNVNNLLLIFGFVFLLYGHTISYNYSHFDDDGLIESNYDFFDKSDDITYIFTSDAFLDKSSSFYRPMQNISYLIDSKIAGKPSPWMFHLSSVLIFYFLLCCIYILFFKITEKTKIAFIGTLLFASHPLFVSSVAWIPARGDLLLALFTVLSFIFYLDFNKNNSYKNLLLSCLFFIFALFSKETAAFIPLVFLVYSLLINRNLRFIFNFRYIILVALVLFSIIIWFFLRQQGVSPNVEGEDFTTQLQYSASNLWIILVSITQLVIPFEFSTFPEISITKIILGTVILMIVVIIFVRKKIALTNNDWFYLFWFFLFLFPTFIIKHKLIDYLDHRFLLPMIGIFLFIISCKSIVTFKNGQLKYQTVFYIIIITFSFISFFKAKAYANPISFYTYAVNYNSSSAIGYNNRGIEYQKEGKMDIALRDFDTAIKIKPDYRAAYYNRAMNKYLSKDYYGAINDFNFEIKLNNDPLKSFYYRGIVYSQIRDYQKAIADFKKYLTKDVLNPEVYYDMGVTYRLMNNNEEAIMNLNTAVKLNPEYINAYNNLVYIKYLQKDYLGALNDCNKILSINYQDENAISMKQELEAIINKENK